MVLICESDTTGEKDFEEFHKSEILDMDKFSGIEL